VTLELLAGGNLGDAGFDKAVAALGHQKLVDTVGAVGHFCMVCMMANTVGATTPDGVPVTLKI
jgi:hypothetical protein